MFNARIVTNAEGLAVNCKCAGGPCRPLKVSAISPGLAPAGRPCSAIAQERGWTALPSIVPAGFAPPPTPDRPDRQSRNPHIAPDPEAPNPSPDARLRI